MENYNNDEVVVIHALSYAGKKHNLVNVINTSYLLLRRVFMVVDWLSICSQIMR